MVYVLVFLHFNNTDHLKYYQIDIVADNTSDEKILRALRNKIDISSQVLAEGYKDWII